MTWFPDGSPYSYMTSGDSRAINVGWLDGTHAFPQAPPTTELLTALFDKCGEPANKTRGWHRCELCDAPAPFLVERHGQNLLPGGAEIRVETDPSRAPDTEGDDMASVSVFSCECANSHIVFG